MRDQVETHHAEKQCKSHGSAFGFLVAGLGVGAVLSIFLAPKSGAETRKWIAQKCLDRVESANVKVRQARIRIHEFVDEGQRRVSEAVVAGREAVAQPKAETKHVAV